MGVGEEVYRVRQGLFGTAAAEPQKSLVAVAGEFIAEHDRDGLGNGGVFSQTKPLLG